MSEQAEARRRLIELKKRQSRGAIQSPGASDLPVRLTHQQEALWFLDALTGRSEAYNEAIAFRIDGSLEPERLERSLRALITRHESLRTAVLPGDAHPVLSTLEPEDALSRFALSIISPAESDEMSQLQSLAALPFDLTRAPLFRAYLITKTPSQGLLLIVTHHILFDGWSASVLAHDLGTFYANGGDLSGVPALPIQFPAFAAGQRSEAALRERQRELEYWGRQLAGLTTLDLPTDRPRPPSQSFAGDAIRFIVDVAVADRLRALSRAHGATLFMTLLAAFQAFLARYSQQRDIAVGVPVAGRNATELEPLIGYFVNTLVMRASLEGNPRFVDVLDQVKTTVLEGLAHQDLPFDQLVVALSPARALDRNPLYQTAFALQNHPRPLLTLPGLRSESLRVKPKRSKFDMNLTMFDEDGVLSGELEYATDLFDKESVDQFSRHFQAWLAAIGADPAERVEGIQFLSAAERHELIEGSNDCRRAYRHDIPIHRLIFEKVQETPSHLAVVCGDECLSYSELRRRWVGLAGRLRALGAGPGVVVGVCMERSVELLVSLLAVLESGGAFLPLDPDYPEERLRWMRSDSRAAVVLTQAALVERTAAWAGTDTNVVVVPRGEWDNVSLATGQLEVTQPAHPAYVLYTSGSTGVPKGVVVPHRALSNHELWFCDALGLGPSDRVLLKTTISFDAMIPECFSALVSGGTVVIASPGVQRDPARLLEEVQEHRVTVVQWGPAEIRALLDQPALAKCTQVRQVISGGEALDRVLANAFHQVLPHTRLGNFYGPTEATVDSAYYQIEGELPAGATVPIGRPIGNAELYILDDLMQPVPVGVTAQLYVGGAGLALGYLRRDDLTAERFVLHPFRSGARLYRTGDLARRDRYGLVSFVGRADRQIKLRGQRVELGEIEAAVRECPGIRDVVILLREDVPGTRVIVGYVDAAEDDLAGAHRRLRARLPESMVPSALVRVSPLPLAPNGKIDHARLPKPSLGRDGRVFVPPRSPAEETLAGIWQAVLKVEGIGAHDDFFALGGHSLSATQVVARVKTHFGIDLPLRVCFEARTVASMTEAIVARTQPLDVASTERIVRVPRNGPAPVSFSQRRMWLLQQLEPDGAAYNMKMAVRLKGPLQRQHLVAAIDRLVKSHEAFRTTFRMGPHEPEACVGPMSDATVVEVDVSGTPREEREAHAHRVMREIAVAPFDLAVGPLYRVVLVGLDRTDHALMLVMHHVIGDDWSFGVLRRQLESAYNALVSGHDPERLEPDLDFIDYAAWQRKTFDHAALGPHVVAWIEALRGAAPLNLPRDFTAHTRATSTGSVVRISISEDRRNRLLSLCGRYSVSPYMVMLGAFLWLLSKYCRQTDISIGTPVANRTKIEAERVIGSLVNTLIVRTSLDGVSTFADVLARTKESALFAFTHQDLPYDYLVERLREVNGKAADVHVLFNVLNSPDEELQLERITSQYMSVDSGAVQFDLAMHVDLDVARVAELKYSTELFDHRTAERMAHNYFGLLDRVLDAPHTQLDSVSVVGADERRRLTQWNTTNVDVAGPYTIHERFVVQACRTPDATALKQHGGIRLTFEELGGRVHQLARVLRAKGIRRGQLVGLFAERGIPTVVALLAILEAGAAYVPLDPVYPAARLQYMADDAGLALLVTQSSLLGAVEWPREDTLLLDIDYELVDGEPAIQIERDSEADARADDPAYVIYTSGSTGKPKGVVVPHRAVVNFLSSMAREPGLTSRDRLVAVTTISFDISVLELLLPLTVGGTVVLATKEEAADGILLRGLLERHCATVMQATPSTWRMLIDAGWTGSPHFKALIGGEAMPADLALQLLERSGELWNMYGPTETTVWSTCWRVENLNSGVSIGRPIANTQVYVVDPAGQLCPIGAPGEIVIGGTGVTLGYLHRETLTAERFEVDRFSAVPGARMYRTGDLGRWRQDGLVEHLGRLDFQVKVRGHRIELGEIETALVGHPSVDRVIVIVREDRPGDARLVAYVVPRQCSLEARDLRDFLRASLPAYMVPQHFVELSELPLLPNGKIDRHALPAPQQIASPAEEHTATDGAERVLIDIWKELLGVEQVSPSDTFLDLGGHSLLAMRAIVEIERRLGVRIELRRLIFESLQQIAASLPDASDDSSHSRPMPVEMVPAERRGWLGRLRSLLPGSR